MEINAGHAISRVVNDALIKCVCCQHRIRSKEVTKWTNIKTKGKR